VTAEDNACLNCVPDAKDYPWNALLFDAEKSVGDRITYEPRDGFRTRRVSAQHSVISEQPQFAKPAGRRFLEAAALGSLSSSSSAVSMVPASIRAARRAPRTWIFTAITQLLAMCGLWRHDCVFDEAQ
jgi:hypothetical protein